MNRIHLPCVRMACFLSSILSLSLCVCAVHAGKDNNVLLRYGIHGLINAEPLPATQVQEGINASSLTVAPDLKPVNYGNHAKNNTATRGHFDAMGWPKTNEANPNAYIEFRLAPQCGWEVSLDAIKFTLYSSRDYYDINKVRGPRFWKVLATIEEPQGANDVSLSLWNTLGYGLASFVGIAGEEDGVIYIDDKGEYTTGTAVQRISLSQLRKFKNIFPGSTIVVRFYGYGSDNGKGGFYFEGKTGSDVVLYGSTKRINMCERSQQPSVPSSGHYETVAYLIDGTWGHEKGGNGFITASNVARLRKYLTGIDMDFIDYQRGVGNELDMGLASQYAVGGLASHLFWVNFESLSNFSIDIAGLSVMSMGKNGLRFFDTDSRGDNALEMAQNIYERIVKNYNEGKTGIVIIGWSRGAAIGMQVSNLIYWKGIPNFSSRGGFFVEPKSDCIVTDQMHLLDTVHSMGATNHGWYDKALPPNINIANHYLADVENPPIGFSQTRPPNAKELFVCREIDVVPSHGDVGGATGSECGQIVFNTLLKSLNSQGKLYSILDPDSAPLSKPTLVKIFRMNGTLAYEEVASPMHLQSEIE